MEARLMLRQRYMARGSSLLHDYESRFFDKEHILLAIFVLTSTLPSQLRIGPGGRVQWRRGRYLVLRYYSLCDDDRK